jgi:integrase/recombinase XerD
VTLVAGLLEAFFTERLQRQRNASTHMIAAYRDTFRLLPGFAQDRLQKPPSALPLSDLDAPSVAELLHRLEKQRKNRPRTRNARLAAIHSFFRFVALQELAYSAACQRVLAIPTKKVEHKLVTSLSRPEQEALLAIPDRSTWPGRRDHAVIMLLLQTGLRVPELCDLRCNDIVLGTGARVRCRGKGAQGAVHAPDPRGRCGAAGLARRPRRAMPRYATANTWSERGRRETAARSNRHTISVRRPGARFTTRLATLASTR